MGSPPANDETQPANSSHSNTTRYQFASSAWLKVPRGELAVIWDLAAAITVGSWRASWRSGLGSDLGSR
jgi:hypothetical protein